MQFNQKTWFSIVFILGTILPILNFENLSTFVIITFYGYVLANCFNLEKYTFNLNSIISLWLDRTGLFLLLAILPFGDAFIAAHWGTFFAFLYLYFIALIFNYESLKSRFMAIFTLLACILAVLQANSNFAENQSRIERHQAHHSASGIIPDNVTEEVTYGSRGAKNYNYYLNINNLHFNCEMETDDDMDKLLCQDIYQYAGKTADISYFFQVNEQLKILSVQVDKQVLWSPKQTLTLHQNNRNRFVDELLSGLLWITLPFTFLYFWARKIVQAA